MQIMQMLNCRKINNKNGQMRSYKIMTQSMQNNRKKSGYRSQIERYCNKTVLRLVKINAYKTMEVTNT